MTATAEATHDDDPDHERGDQPRLARGARPARADDADRPGHRPVRRHLRRHARPLRRLRRGADPRRAALRVGDGRLRHRPRDHGRAGGVRDRVLRLRRRGDGPDLQPGGEAPLLHRRQADRAARDPDADRGPDGDGPAALAEPRVVVHAHPRHQDRHAVQRRRRIRADADRAARSQPRALRRERAALRTARRGRDRARRSRSAGRASPARAPTPPSSRSRAWSTRRSRPPTGSPSAASRSR